MKERIKSFIEGIKVFGHRFVKEEDYNKAYSNEAERLKLITERDKLFYENSKFGDEIMSLREGARKIPLSISIGDPTPQKLEERKTYVTEVAGFHKTHLHNKLLHMIHVTHLLLEEEGTAKTQDDMMKGAIYAFRELDRWGNMMTSESMSYKETD